MRDRYKYVVDPVTPYFYLSDKHANIINIQEIDVTSSNNSQLTCIKISTIKHHSGNITYTSSSHVINS